MSREDKLKDSQLCQAKLDEAIARIRSLEGAINDLTKRAENWEELYKDSTKKLEEATKKLEAHNVQRSLE